MNIDNSSLLSLLSPALVSPDKNLESLKQTLQLDVNGAQEFTDTLLTTLKQISDIENSDKQVGNGTINLSENTNKLHQIAGLLNGNETDAGFSSFFGKGLPVINRLEKSIDLENTMEALANVMNTLEDVVLKDIDIEQKLDVLVEKMEAMKAILPKQNKLTWEKLADEMGTMTKELENIKDVIIKNNNLGINTLDAQDETELYISEVKEPETKKISNTQLENNAVSKQSNNEDSQSSQVKKVFTPVIQISSKETVSHTGSLVKEESSSMAINLVNRLDKVVDAVKQINDAVVKENSLDENGDLENQAEKVLAEIEIVIAEIETVKTVISEKNTIQHTGNIGDKTQNDGNSVIDKKQGDTEFLQLDNTDKDHDNLTLEMQIAEIVATLDKPWEKEKITSPNSFFEVKPNLKKEALPLKQTSEEMTLGIKSKAESEMLVQQENSLNKPEHEIPFVKAKQIEKAELLEGKEFETKLEKSSAKFTTDMANLSRSIRLENKTDIAPMSKHFSHPEWNKEMSERVIWMHKQEIPSAELRLNPRHLGPVTIKIDVTQDQATVAFTAQHAAVKEAIEAALPKLREMFSSQQLNLAEVNVSQEDAGHRQSRGFSQMGSDSESKNDKERGDLVSSEQAENSLEIVDEIEAGRAIASNGILSIFA